MHGTEPATPEDAARDAAFRWLARAARSGAEVERYLTGRGFASALVSRTLQGLRDLGYVDDAALARRRAEDLMLQRGWGRLRVVHELTRRGLADSVIDTAIAVILQDRTDADLARAALDRRLARRPLTSADDRARAFRYLIGRGHPLEAVTDVLGEDE